MSAKPWTVITYARIRTIDAACHATGQLGPRRFERLTGSEADMRETFKFYKDVAYPHVLAAELYDPSGAVVDRYDRLMDLLPALTPARVMDAILEPIRDAQIPL